MKNKLDWRDKKDKLISCDEKLKVLNEKKYSEVPFQIKRWNKAGGSVNNGLVRRREAEAALWEGRDWTNI